jgi:uncharacterized membrane protein YozB (DUF420 family)
VSTLAVTVRSRSDRLFHVGMAIAMLVTVFVGFAPTFYLRLAHTSLPLTPLVQVHGILFSGWMLLLLAQTVLVASGRTAVHRRLGMAGAVLAVALFVVGAMTAIAAARRGQAFQGVDPLPFLAIPLATILVFVGTVATALGFRRRSDIHKRLMLIATIGALTPAIARMNIELGPLHGPPLALFLTDLFILPCLVNDRLRIGRIHPAYLWGAGILLFSQIGRLLIMRTDAWIAIATWLTR